MAMFALPFRPGNPAINQAVHQFVQQAAAPPATTPSGLPASSFEYLYKLQLDLAFGFYEDDNLLLCYRACMDLVENPHVIDWTKVRALKLLALLSSVPTTSLTLLAHARVLCDNVRISARAQFNAEMRRRYDDPTITREDRKIQDNAAREAYQARDADFEENAAHIWKLEQDAIMGRNLFAKSGKGHLNNGGIEQVLAEEGVRCLVGPVVGRY